MTVAVALPNPATSVPQPAPLTARTDGCEPQGSVFAVLLAALARSSDAATQQDCLSLPQGVCSASKTAAPTREAGHELRTAEFKETGVFGLMGIGALTSGAEDSATLTQPMGPGLKTSAQRPPQQPHAPDVTFSGAALGSSTSSATVTPSASPRSRLEAPPLAHPRPQDVIADAAPAAIRVQRQAESRSPARIAFHSAAKHALLLASGQTSAVHVAIAAAEHGVSVFARVGRMEPTERARLRHAAASILAEYGHHLAIVTLDVDIAETRGR